MPAALIHARRSLALHEMEFCFNIQGLPSPLLWVRKRLSVPAFDTSKILIRPNAVFANFGVSSAAELARPQFDVSNTSDKTVIFAYVRYSLAVPDARLGVGSHFRNLDNYSLNNFIDTHLGFLPGGGWVSRGVLPIFAVNGIYSGTLILEEVAGFAFDAGRMGFGVNTDYASFPVGPCMEAFKFAPALAIPFSGEVEYYS